MTNDTRKQRLFVTPDGRNLTITFILVSSLFLLWGFCNGMIDVMDKHFQDELNLTLAQSANVQWAHYLGYFLMSHPGRLAGEQTGLQRRHHRRAADGGRRADSGSFRPRKSPSSGHSWSASASSPPA